MGGTAFVWTPESSDRVLGFSFPSPDLLPQKTSPGNQHSQEKGSWTLFLGEGQDERLVSGHGVWPPPLATREPEVTERQ